MMKPSDQKSLSLVFFSRTTAADVEKKTRFKDSYEEILRQCEDSEFIQLFVLDSLSWYLNPIRTQVGHITVMLVCGSNSFGSFLFCFLVLGFWDFSFCR